MEVEKSLEEKLLDLREDYLGSLNDYSFTNEEDLKKEYQNMVFRQEIAKHFLDFALNRVETITLKEGLINNEALEKIPSKEFMTMACGVENKEAEMIVFSSSNLELEFVFDYDAKEVTMKGRRCLSYFDKKETFCHVIPFGTFNILAEYMPRTKFNISEDYKDEG